MKKTKIHLGQLESLEEERQLHVYIHCICTYNTILFKLHLINHTIISRYMVFKRDYCVGYQRKMVDIHVHECVNIPLTIHRAHDYKALA